MCLGNNQIRTRFAFINKTFDHACIIDIHIIILSARYACYKQAVLPRRGLRVPAVYGGRPDGQGIGYISGLYRVKMHPLQIVGGIRNPHIPGNAETPPGGQRYRLPANHLVLIVYQFKYRGNRFLPVPKGIQTGNTPQRPSAKPPRFLAVCRVQSRRRRPHRPFNRCKPDGRRVEIHLERHGQGFGLVVDFPLVQRGLVAQFQRRGGGLKEVVEIPLGLGKPGDPVLAPLDVVPRVRADIAAGNIGGHYRGAVRRFQQGRVKGRCLVVIGQGRYLRPLPLRRDALGQGGLGADVVCRSRGGKFLPRALRGEDADFFKQFQRSPADAG